MFYSLGSSELQGLQSLQRSHTPAVREIDLWSLHVVLLAPLIPLQPSVERFTMFCSLTLGGSRFFKPLLREGYNFSVLQYFRICNPPSLIISDRSLSTVYTSLLFCLLGHLNRTDVCMYYFVILAAMLRDSS